MKRLAATAMATLDAYRDLADQAPRDLRDE